jgi:large subunit ribosomal protein L5
MSFIKENYKNKVVGNLKKKFKYENVLEIPRVEKVCLNVAFKASGVDGVDSNFILYVANQLTQIAGQKAVMIKAKNSISTFKVRENMPIACRVTLRKDKMYEFLDRLLYIALPRIKDFKGLSSNSFNQSGHYSFGIKEHTIFPEVELDKVTKVFGMDINVVTTTKNKDEAGSLLKELGFPIK